MDDVPLLLEVGVPLLALVSVLAIAWARRQDEQVRGQAASLCRRLERELTALINKGERTRLRIGLIVELYCGGRPPKKDELTEDCDDLLAYVESLQVELDTQVGCLQQLGGRELRVAHGRIAAILNEARELAREFEERDSYWSKQLDGMTVAKPAGARSTRVTMPVLH